MSSTAAVVAILDCNSLWLVLKTSTSAAQLQQYVPAATVQHTENNAWPVERSFSSALPLDGWVLMELSYG